MKFRKNKHSKLPLTLAKIRQSLLFGAIFGLIMLIVGLSQLFAQSTVAFYLNPYYQTANANEDRSLSITLANSGQQVDGGSVKITYNPAQVSFISFNDPVSTQIGVSNRVNSPGSYSYDFQIHYGSQNLPSLGTLVLKTKASSSQQSAFVDFVAADTKAYFMSGASRSYYPTSHGRAVILVNASTSTPPSNPPPNQPPAQPSGPTNSPPASNTTPQTTAPPTANNPPASNNSSSNAGPSIPGPGEDPGGSGQYYDPAFENSQAEGFVSLPKRKGIAPIVFILIGVVCLAAAGGAFIYLKYFRGLPIAVGIGRSLHGSLFKDVPEDITDGGIVISPVDGATPEHDLEPSEHIREPKAHPAIIKKSRLRSLRHRAAEFRKKKPAVSDQADDGSPSARAQPRQTELDHPAERHSAHAAAKSGHHHEESETITISLHPHTAAPSAPVPHIATPAPHAPAQAAPIHAKPALAPQPAVPTASVKHDPAPVSPPLVPPPLIPVPTTVGRPDKEPATTTSDPGHQVPDWQAHIKVRNTQPANDDDPPDMFELAHDHPESFGSSQLYEEETKEKENHGKSPN